MERYQIFISYRRDGGEFFGKILSDKLIAKGYSVFFDVEALRSGPFNDQLYQVLDQCQDFIVILSPHALDRCVNPGDWVCSEIAYAIQQKKNIVPIVLRDFVWPEILPEAIRTLPLYEQEELARVTSHEHIDASVQRICRALLKSRPAGSGRFHMAEKEYYPIKTHWNNPYKRARKNRSGLTKLLAEIAETMRVGGDIPGDQEPQTVQQLKEQRPYLDIFGMNWLEINGPRLDQIRQLAQELKACWTLTGNVEPYYYANAVQYAIGNMLSLSTVWDGQQMLIWQWVLSYCLDWPREKLSDLCSALGDDGYEEFRLLLLSAVEVWPKIKNAVSGERDQAEQYYILLFDFLLEFSLLIHDTVRNGQYWSLVRTQILSYYKWLRKHKLYLPRELQEKIYRYFQ